MGGSDSVTEFLVWKECRPTSRWAVGYEQAQTGILVSRISSSERGALELTSSERAVQGIAFPLPLNPR